MTEVDVWHVGTLWSLLMDESKEPSWICIKACSGVVGFPTRSAMLVF